MDVSGETEDCCIITLASACCTRSFVLGKPSERTNNFPQRGRGLGHVTPTIFGIRSNISSKLLELGSSSFLHSFVFGKPSGRCKNLALKGRVVGHVTIKIFGIRLALLNFLIKQQILNIKKTYQFTTPCKSDEVTHPKQHKSFFSGIM